MDVLLLEMRDFQDKMVIGAHLHFDLRHKIAHVISLAEAFTDSGGYVTIRGVIPKIFAIC